MKVNLYNNDQTTVIATVDVPDFPDNPTILKHDERYYTVAFGYGADSTSYVEQTFLEV